MLKWDAWRPHLCGKLMSMSSNLDGDYFIESREKHQQHQYQYPYHHKWKIILWFHSDKCPREFHIFSFFCTFDDVIGLLFIKWFGFVFDVVVGVVITSFCYMYLMFKSNIDSSENSNSRNVCRFRTMTTTLFSIISKSFSSIFFDSLAELKLYKHP